MHVLVNVLILTDLNANGEIRCFGIKWQIIELQMELILIDINSIYGRLKSFFYVIYLNVIVNSWLIKIKYILSFKNFSFEVYLISSEEKSTTDPNQNL